MEYPIKDLEKIEPHENYGKVILIIFLTGNKQGFEADYVEFDHVKGIFTAYTY